MHPVAIVLVLSAAVAHAGWNIFAKRVPDGGALFVWLGAAWSGIFLLPVTVVIVWRDGMAASWWLAFAVSGVVHLGYFVLLQRGYRVGDLSVVYPLARGTGPLLSVVAAVWLLGERPGLVALAGAAAVVAGVFIIGGLGTGPGVGYGLATGTLIATYTLWDAHAVTALAVPPVLLMCGSALVETVLLAPYALARRDAVGRIWREHRAAVLAVAVLSPLAYVLVLFAMRLAPVSMVAPARELSIVAGSLGAWLLLGEPNPVRRLSGAVIVLAGVAAIAVA
ncbi:EamA family transporter [Actinophytocola glycyrrhizae]|uniref:EamA family transporter n=1 Tax=Actinophytocola glycyrrhizae TaxID=2044873 RepID=A0ABV9SBR1_9PSEU